MEPLPLYILAGGRSSRFGSDKALAQIDGVPLLKHVQRQWTPWTREVCVVADVADKYATLGLRTIADRLPGRGPMGGLAAALADRGEGWIILAGCDAVMVDVGIPEAILSARSDAVDAVALRGERWEPLPALFHARALPKVEEALENGQLSLWRLIEAVRHQAVALSAGALVQLNTPSDLAAFAAGQRGNRDVPPVKSGA